MAAKKRGRSKARRREFVNPSIEIAKTQIPDPFEPSRKIVVRRNVRTDPIEYLFARKRIDTALKTAADRFLALWELSAGGSLRSLDPSRDRVDTSRTGSGPSDGALAARDSLDAVRRHVGRSGYSILSAVCGERQAIGDVALAFYEGSRRAEYLVRTRLIETLEELAELWGLAATAPPPRPRQTAWASEDGRPKTVDPDAWDRDS